MTSYNEQCEIVNAEASFISEQLDQAISERDQAAASYARDRELFARQEERHRRSLAGRYVPRLVEALKGLVDGDFGADGWNEQLEQFALQARALLAEIEASHE